MQKMADHTNRGGTTAKRSQFKSMLAVSAMHFINDLHPTFLPTFLPEIVKRLSLSLAEAGFLSTLFGILNVAVQPLAGQLADKTNRPVFALYAPLLTAGGACLLPIAPTYGMALLFVVFLGTGTASFHPQGHGLTGIAGGTERLGSYLAVFAAAGTLGAALSPLYAVFLLRTLGPSRVPLALLVVVAFILITRRWLSADAREERQPGAEQKGPRQSSMKPSMARVLKICLALILISIMRDSTSQGVRVFLPLLVTSRGGSLEAGGTVLFAFTLAGSFANLCGGKLADKFGKKPVIVTMMLLAPLFLFPAIQMSGILSIALFICGGICISATSPITLAMAQELVPESRSTASSLVMGISWGVANIVASPIGMLADRIGLVPTLSIVALVPLTVDLYFAADYFKKKRRATRT